MSSPLKPFSAFCLAIGATLGIHALCLLGIHGMVLSSPRQGRMGLIEHQQGCTRNPLTALDRVDAERSQALAEALNGLYQPCDKTKSIPIDPSSVDEQLLLTSSSQLDYSGANLDSSDLSMAASQDTSLPALPQVTATVLAPSDSLAPATHRLLGDIAISDLEASLTQDKGLKIGEKGLFEEGLLALNEREGASASELISLLPPVSVESTAEHRDASPQLQIDNWIPLLSRPDRKVEDAPELARIASSQDFDLQSQIAPLPQGAGYFFRLALLPKPEALFKRIRQNYYFLIDRSHSIPAERFTAFKDTVLSTLQLLHPGDRFNILVFDDKVVRFHDEPIQWSPKQVEEARAFLAKQQHGGLFASTELYASLHRILPEDVSQQEMHTAILLSDGDTFLRMDQQRAAIADWTRSNQGKVTLFSIAAEGGNNLALLDLLSRLNRGKALYATKHDDLSYLLERLIRAVRNPIGKDLVAAVIPRDPEARFRLYPAAHRMPQLYEHWPLVIEGTVDRLCDFHLFIQGMHSDRWLDLSHVVDLEAAESIEASALTAELHRLAVHDCYEHFL
ncbi:MAG: hypothetical protein KDK78_03920, partial [Chlamydiia bacterium]|nr:hypothetical protein [Chlamydiia bacterium]